MKKRLLRLNDEDFVTDALSKTPEIENTGDSESSDVAIPIDRLKRWGNEWLEVSEDNDHSIQTIKRRQIVLDQLFWLLDREKCAQCGRGEIRLYMRHMKRGHLEKGGRWGNPRNKTEASRGTINTNFGHLRAFFNWLQRERKIAESPMLGMDNPPKSKTKIEAFSIEQLQAMEKVVKKSNQAKRDQAMFYLLWDTGLRNSELCNLTHKDIDFNRTVPKMSVMGKGEKPRDLPLGRAAARALWEYLHPEPKKRSKSGRANDIAPTPLRHKNDPVFTSRRGRGAATALTRSGLQQAVERWGVAAKIADHVRCSPHTFRHTFAVNFLRNGGNMFALMDILGHTNVQMVKRYVQLAEADIEGQHRRASPVDNYKGEAKTGKSRRN